MTSSSFVIAIAGHSGSGKSTIIENLVSSLGDAVALGIDDYTSSATYPPAVKWIADGADPNEFQTPQFVDDIRALKTGKAIIHPETGLEVKPTRYLILEEPFGRGRDALRELIDFLVYVDIPLEVAYARKLLRKSDFLPWEDDPELFMKNLRENLSWFLRVGRSFYVAVSNSAMKDCDLIVDGMLPTQKIAEEIHQAVTGKSSN